MMDYSTEPKDRIFVKRHGFLSFTIIMGKNISKYGFLPFALNMGKTIGKNISKNLSSKYGREFLDHAKQSTSDTLKLL